MREVDGEHELPGGWSNRYIRNAIDPRVLVNTETGECFIRRDEQPWTRDMYESQSPKVVQYGSGHKAYLP